MEIEPPSSGAQSRAKFFTLPVILCLFVALLWVFPKFWYRHDIDPSSLFWLSAPEVVAGSKFERIPVSESAEKLLVADSSVNGEFLTELGEPIRVFCAKRYEEKQNEIGLFMHTPDRCWTQSGWKLEPTEKTITEVDVHGVTIPFERRIFTMHGRRELVYFAGLVAGRPLPYRLDHNLSVGMRYGSTDQKDKSGSILRATDLHFWARLWESFTSRRELMGPKQFIRISTSVGSNEADADARLRKFLPLWLKPGNYQTEKSQWQVALATKPE